MLGRSAAVLVMAALFVVGCNKKNDDTKPNGEPAAKAGEPAAIAKTGGPKTLDWSKVERVPFAKLQSLLPATVLGMKRTDLSGRTVPGDEMFTEATAEYEGPNDMGLTISIEDNPTMARSALSPNTTPFKGHPLVAENESSDSADIAFVVGARFYVRGRGPNIKVAQIKSAFDAVDLTKLASWKDEGIK